MYNGDQDSVLVFMRHLVQKTIVLSKNLNEILPGKYIRAEPMLVRILWLRDIK